MADLMELFAVLDSWETKNLPTAIKTNPDPALEAARLALRDKADPSAALRLIEEQIAIYRPLVRAARLDLLNFSDPRSTASPEKLRHLGVDLHQHAALLNMKLMRWDAARMNLLQAIAIDPSDSTPRFHFAEFYEKTGAFQDAFSLLDFIFDRSPGKESGGYQLYLLSLSAQKAGVLEEARHCYTRLIARDDQDLYAGLARLQLSRLDNGTEEMPPDQDIEALYRRAASKLRQREFISAAESFSVFLSWVPDHPVGWYEFGSAHEKQARSAGVPAEGRLTEPAFRGLNCAVKAYQQALLFDPNLTIAQCGLAECFMQLGRPAQAVEPILAAVQAEPRNLTVLMHTARIFLANGDAKTAIQAIQSALRIDPNLREAKELMAWIVSSIASEESRADES